MTASAVAAQLSLQARMHTERDSQQFENDPLT